VTKIRLGVIFGGRSGEHEVSLRSAESVMRELDRDKYEVIPFAITKSGRWRYGPDALEKMEKGLDDQLTDVGILAEPGHDRFYKIEIGEALNALESVDILFPVLHGTFGEDGTIQGLFELAEIPYVGAGVLASSVGMDKAIFKDVMQANGIPVVEFLIINASDIESGFDQLLDEVEQLGPYPLFVKPANLGSSVGITKCRSRSDLLEGLMDASRFDRRIIIERGIDAREIEVSVLGNEYPEASVAGEIVPGDEFYSYRAKYLDETSELHIPADLNPSQADEIRQMAINAFTAIDGAGMARVDFLLERGSGHIYLNELNTIPGFTSISMYPKLWEASGLSYPNLLDRLIELAFDRHKQKANLERSYEVGSA
jgi:D-alanine-D-alanine ligase